MPPEGRAAPLLFMPVDRDYGRIDPHKSRLPRVVEVALFFLLLAPWENWSQVPHAYWRRFQVPWVYTVDDDIFVRPNSPPSPDDLSLELQPLTDARGEVVDVELPVVNPLEGVDLCSWDDKGWQTLARALNSPLFETPVVHFFVRAFLANGVDEVLAHLTAIEAALGIQADYIPRLRTSHASIGATRRLASRIAALLGDVEFSKQYDDLFTVRCEYLHGRAMEAISSAKRVCARKLSRQVVAALVKVAAETAVASRGDYLNELLDRGVCLCRLP
jgi:hypothetical protein